MSIVLNDPVVRQDIVDRFNTRVRDLVILSTNWNAATPVWGVPLSTVTSTSMSRAVSGVFTNRNTADPKTGPYINQAGGAYNRTAETVGTPSEVLSQADFASLIGVSLTTSGYITKILRDILIAYAKNHKINLVNTGNIQYPGTPTTGTIITAGSIIYTGTARLNGVVSAVTTNMESDITAAINTRNLNTGQVITATNLYNFIEDCRTIWLNRCFNSAVEQYRYSYCHGSCHSSHGSHGSRGRR